MDYSGSLQLFRETLGTHLSMLGFLGPGKGLRERLTLSPLSLSLLSPPVRQGSGKGKEFFSFLHLASAQQNLQSLQLPGTELGPVVSGSWYTWEVLKWQGVCFRHFS